MLHKFQPIFKMLIPAFTIVLSLAPQFGLAYNQRDVSSSTTNSAPAATHSINVGADGLSFTPNSVTANVGDEVLFRFYPQNHSVARAGYMEPCIPYELTGAGRQGFWSGFHPINEVLSNPPLFSVIVNDTAPIFFYCSAPDACTKNGMVGVINPNSTETLAVQVAYALNSTIELSPGQSFPAEGSPTATVSSITSTSTPTPTPTGGPLSSATNTPVTVPSSQHVLSGGAIGGIAIGGAAVLMIGAALVYFCGRQRTVREILQTQAVPSYQPGAGQMSLASSAGYIPKYPQVGIDPMGHRRYSSQVGMYDHPSGTETESYRSRSPPLDDSRDGMLTHMNFTPSPGTTSPARVDSPLMRSSLSPGRPTRQSQSNPISPMDETMYQPLVVEIPPALRFNRLPSQTGPHELSTENDSSYFSYPPVPPVTPVPPPRDSRRDSKR